MASPALIANGDTGATARAFINGLLGKSAPLGGVSIVCDGDSKGAEPFEAMKYIAWRAGLEIILDVTPINIGGSGTDSSSGATAGLTNSTRMANIAATLAAQKALGRTFDYHLKIGTNDATGSVSSATTIANIRKVHETIVRPSGARYFVLWSQDPRGGSNNGSMVSLNNIYRAYALANSADTIFIDTHNAVLDVAAANTANAMLGASTGANGAVSYDGTHLNQWGVMLSSYAAETAIKQIYALRPLPDLSITNLYGSGNLTYANFLGAKGRMVSQGGTAGFTGGTETSTPPSGFTSGGDLKGMTAAWSLVTTVPGLETATGRTGWPAVRLTFSGTPSAVSSLTVQATAFPSGLAIGDVLRTNLLVNFNSMVGLAKLGPAPFSPIPQIGSGITTNASYNFALLNGLYNIESDNYSLPSVPGGWFQTINLMFQSGNPVSGSIDFIQTGINKVGPIPAATP